MAIKSFCFTHTGLSYTPPADTIIIWSGHQAIDQRFADRTIRVADHYNDLDALHPFLSGNSGTFALRRLLLESKIDFKENDLLNLSQYRKFIVGEKFGIPSPEFPGMQIVSKTEANQIDILTSLQKKTATHPYVLGQPVNLGHLYSHYAFCHKAEDLLRYVAIAIEQGVISRQESWNFLILPNHIPGSFEFGVMPVTTFLKISEAVERISLSFLRQHLPVDMTPLQRRATAFCAERIGSYLLQKEFTLNYGTALPAEFFGWMHTVNDVGEYLPGG